MLKTTLNLEYQNLLKSEPTLKQSKELRVEAAMLQPVLGELTCPK